MEVNQFCFKVLLVLLNISLAFSSSIQTMAETCVLSLVVPRDKIKTSCSVDDRLKRRLNTMETKINIYKQQVLELETQIHKERLLNNDKIMSLETMLSKVDKLEELDKRLAYVESLQQRELDNFIPKDTSFRFSTDNDNFIPSDQVLDTTSYLWQEYKPVSKKMSDKDKTKLIEKLENMKKNINETGNNIVNKMEDVLKNVSANVSLNRTYTNDLEDSLIGDNGSAFSELPQIEKGNKIQNDQPTKIRKLANSGTASNDTDRNENNNVDNAETNIIPSGRNPLIDQLEEMLKKEIEQVLNEQMEEVISLVRKQSETFVTSQIGQTDSINILSDQHLSDIQYLNERVDSVELNMKSLTQTMETMYAKNDKLQVLPALIEELKKNISENHTDSRLNVDSKNVLEMLDEHSKKLRTFDRLTGIFQRSLEHYRNESKMSYAEIEQKMDAETTRIRSLKDNILNNVTLFMEDQITLQNTTIRRKLRDVERLMKNIEEQNVLMQIDIDTKERRLKSRTSKLENDLKIAKQDIQSMGFSQKRLQKDQEEFEKEVKELSKNSAVSERLDTLELEFKLSLTDDWVEYPFAYDTTRTACFGLQFIKRTKYKNGRYVGAVLCTNHRYKIMLGQTLKDKFMNIGDEVGYGEDHCEFVGGESNNIAKVSKPSYTFTHERGYTRGNWGDEPHIVFLDFIRPSPSWYECGISIP